MANDKEKWLLVPMDVMATPLVLANERTTGGYDYVWLYRGATGQLPLRKSDVPSIPLPPTSKRMLISSLFFTEHDKYEELYGKR